MNSPLKRRHLVAGLLLAMGAIPYCLWRRDALFVQPFAPMLPPVGAPPGGVAGYFLVCNFADAAWYAALLTACPAPAGKGVAKRWLHILTILLPFIHESLQYAGVLPGTFDLLDLLTYFITLIIFHLCTRQKTAQRCSAGFSC